MTSQEEPGSGPEPEASAEAAPDGAEEPGAEEPGSETPPASRAPGWSRVVVFGAAALALLLVGATAGMFLAQNRDSADETRTAPGAGSVEVGFAQDMSVHHVQAVTMANWVRDHSSDPAVVQLAFDIGSTQLEQTGRMKGWLMLWGQPEQPVDTEHMTWMTGSHGQGHSGHGADGSPDGHGGSSGASSGEPLMPGMATKDELARMRSLSGTELDVYFLQLMLRHHEGGVDMAQQAVDRADVHSVRTLAKSMLKAQGAEIDLMRQMLAQRGAQPLPFP